MAAEKKKLWGPDPELVSKDHVLRLHIPVEAVSNGRDEDDIFMAESVKMKLSFIHAHLIPLCKTIDCVLHE